MKGFVEFKCYNWFYTLKMEYALLKNDYINSVDTIVIPDSLRYQKI